MEQQRQTAAQQAVTCSPPHTRQLYMRMRPASSKDGITRRQQSRRHQNCCLTCAQKAGPVNLRPRRIITHTLSFSPAHEAVTHAHEARQRAALLLQRRPQLRANLPLQGRGGRMHKFPAK